MVQTTALELVSWWAFSWVSTRTLVCNCARAVELVVLWVAIKADSKGHQQVVWLADLWAVSMVARRDATQAVSTAAVSEQHLGLQLAACLAAEKAEQKEIDEHIRDSKPMPKTKTSHAVEGVNGVNELIRQLKSFRIENVGYDPMHWASNAGTHFLEFLKGLRGLTDKQRLCCVAQNTFMFMKYSWIHPPWRLLERDIVIIDSLVNALLIPSGFTSLYAMKFPARRTGERSLSTVGRLRNKGGIHYVKSLFYNYIALENTHQYETEIKSHCLDNSLKPKYSDFVLKLIGNGQKTVLHDFVMNGLFDSLVELIEIEKESS
eukprot:gene34619-42707_t